MMRINSLGSDIPYQPGNPTNDDRHMLARVALEQKGRIEDFEYIFKLTSPPPDITSFAKPGGYGDIRVGIVGGGLSGLAAAFELRKLGFDITVFDALEDRIGGRVYTHYFNREKTLYGEMGPMRIPVTHETTWHYINLFRLDTRPFIQVNENALIYLRNIRVRNDPEGRNVMKYIYPRYNMAPWERGISWQNLTYRAFDSHLLRTSPDARSEILQVKPFYIPSTLSWDACSSRRMLESTDLSQDAISLLENFSPLAGENMYKSYIDYIQEVYSVDLSFLYEIPGGIAKLPLAFFNSLTGRNSGSPHRFMPVQIPGHVRFRRGNWVEGIRWNGDTCKVALAYRNKESPRQLYDQFDYVICTIPFSVLRTIKVEPLFSDIKMQAIKEVDYIPAQKAYLMCRHRFWEEGGPGERIIGGVSFTDLPITQVVYPSDHVSRCTGRVNLVPGYNPSYMPQPVENTGKELARQPGALLASYNFNLETTRLANQPERLRMEEIKREVEMVHGLKRGYLDTVVADSFILNWNNEPWFRGALCFYNTEQKRLLSYASAFPEYHIHVFFACEHVSAKHRWMQGALQSGMEAANSVARVCRIRNA